MVANGWATRLVVLLCAWCALTRPAAAVEDPLGSAVPSPNVQDVGFDQHLNAQLPLDLPFVDEAGRPVKLRDYADGKPAVLVLAYYRCPMLCTLVLNAIAATIETVPLEAGKDFHVIVVSFDPRETSALAAAKKKNLLAHYSRAGADRGWHFLTGQAAPIAQLTAAVGFRYQYDARQDLYVHPAGICVLTPAGKIARYLFGIDFASRDLRLALVEASANQIGSPADQVLLYCFHYAPAAGKYTTAVLRLVRGMGLMAIAGVLGLVGILIYRRRRTRRADHEAGG